jgi:hypothetical protein
MIEGSGSIPLSNRSGSRRHKNIRVRRIRIRIRNTAFKGIKLEKYLLIGQLFQLLPGLVQLSAQVVLLLQRVHPLLQVHLHQRHLCHNSEINNA